MRAVLDDALLDAAMTLYETTVELECDRQRISPEAVPALVVRLAEGRTK